MPRPIQPPVPTASDLNALRSMQGNRSRDTVPELLLRRALRDLGLSGYRVSPKNLAGRPDIVFTRSRLAIFVHGCFWHRCPYCMHRMPARNQEYWARKFELNAERDDRKRRALQAAGYEVLEFWECRIRADAQRVAEQVQRAIASFLRHTEADEELAELRSRTKRRRARRTRPVSA